MKTEIATFGGGCFWCIETIVLQLRGVDKVVSGYAGGTSKEAPTYRDVCSGTSGYAEVVQITFDAEILSYHDLITIFMTSHDPTQLNRQGADRGSQYRSVIYYNNEEQRKIAKTVFTELKHHFSDPIVTEIAKSGQFYVAEDAHQNYYKNNTEAGYCRVVIEPKIAKLRAQYADRLK